MKGCSCRTPTDSVLLADILVEVSAWSACGSEHGSGSDALISAFFSALWTCRKKSRVKYKEAASGQAFQPHCSLGERTKKLLYWNRSAASSSPFLPTDLLPEHRVSKLHNCPIWYDLLGCRVSYTPSQHTQSYRFLLGSKELQRLCSADTQADIRGSFDTIQAQICNQTSTYAA